MWAFRAREETVPKCRPWDISTGRSRLGWMTRGAAQGIGVKIILRKVLKTGGGWTWGGETYPYGAIAGARSHQSPPRSSTHTTTSPRTQQSARHRILHTSDPSPLRRPLKGGQVCSGGTSPQHTSPGDLPPGPVPSRTQKGLLCTWQLGPARSPSCLEQTEPLHLADVCWFQRSFHFELPRRPVSEP